jgi:transposase
VLSLDTESGEVLEESRVRTTPEAFQRRFGAERHLHIAIEVGTHSPWVSRLLEECAHEVLVANARKVRLTYGDKRKNGKLDAENLARLARLDPKVLYLLKHRDENSQAHLALIRSREALVGSRAQLINHVPLRSGQILRSSPAQVLGAQLPQEEGSRALAEGA